MIHHFVPLFVPLFVHLRTSSYLFIPLRTSLRARYAHRRVGAAPGHRARIPGGDQSRPVEQIESVGAGVIQHEGEGRQQLVRDTYKYKYVFGYE